MQPVRPPNRLRQGCGGPPKLHAKAEAGRCVGTVAMCVIAVLLPRIASAQARVTIDLNAGVQASDHTLTQSFSVTKNVETAPISVSGDLKRGTWFEGGARVRVVRRLGVGARLSMLSRKKPADITAALPHPFFFNRARIVSGTASLLHRETALHIEASYLVYTTRRIEIAALGGPSIFDVAQNLVTDVMYSDAFPFDTATFVSAPSTRITKTAKGVNLGADITWRGSRKFGVGALVRYTRAAAPFAAARGNSTTLDFGGLQLGGGVRIGL